MKKFIALLLSLNLSANVDWSHESSCSILNSEIQEVEQILSKMTLEQKVGQIIMPDLDAVTPLEAKGLSTWHNFKWRR
jgi:beta-glucosidase